MGVKTTLGGTIVGHISGELGECQAASHAYTFHANSSPEVRADDLMRKMWDEDVMGISDRDQTLTPEEMLAARKTAETRCYTDGRYEVAIPWIMNHRCTATERVLKTDSTLLKNIQRGQCKQGLHTEAGARRSRRWAKLVPTPFSCGERR